ncbi:hypothetical protein DPEC_G00270200 [Dallia pectoralis]|uniref:Uncharacterized protein n=1 Tax=Dallia pectoralis TaxID=75939 RepID=A0ACC2FPE8_DALPE|nr:hypothetical protein DPEC_G00270200 [Dallia pectoralis]
MFPLREEQSRRLRGQERGSRFEWRPELLPPAPQCRLGLTCAPDCQAPSHCHTSVPSLLAAPPRMDQHLLLSDTTSSSSSSVSFSPPRPSPPPALSASHTAPGRGVTEEKATRPRSLFQFDRLKDLLRFAWRPSVPSICLCRLF